MSISSLLKQFNLKYEDLNMAERDTLEDWLQKLSRGEIDVPKIRKYINKMIEGVELELSESKVPVRKDIFLKARLRNYLLLKAFLESPEKAKEKLEASLRNIKPKK